MCAGRSRGVLWGTRALLPALLLLLLAPAVARADDCTGTTDSGGRFATCFDPGNRLVLRLSSEGAGAGIQLRHIMHFEDEPDLVWKMEHSIVDGSYGGVLERYRARLYRGRFLRHARDGHIILPFRTDRKIFLPFDVGAEAEVATLSQRVGAPLARLDVVRTTALVDFGRSPDFGHTLTFGLVADWNVDLDLSPEKEGQIDAVAHHVVPFTAAMAEARYEAASGLTAAALRVEGGGAWNSDTGWGGVFTSSARLERTVLAFNDHPLSLHLGGSYDAARGEWLGEAGLSFALFQRRDPRVNLE
ncbi:MAG TPA: hypothetical protein VMZ28_14520 [Kofleriaceae bacterium]|nr:hypothetical protein [Kofleriaceae bacterium]